jgi:hypothetical protein
LVFVICLKGSPLEQFGYGNQTFVFEKLVYDKRKYPRHWKNKKPPVGGFVLVEYCCYYELLIMTSVIFLPLPSHRLLPLL